MTSLYVSDLKPLPELNRIPGLKLSGQAFSDAIMVFEFLHNYGETLGFGKIFSFLSVATLHGILKVITRSFLDTFN